MRAYVMVTGAVFALVTVVHIWRMVEEPHLTTEPWFLALTILTAALTVAAWRLSRRAPPA